MTLDNSDSTISVKFSAINHKNKIVYGVVYAPDMLDAFGGFSDREEITKLAYRFMQLDLSRVIDTQHDNVPNNSIPIESFIAKEGDPLFPEGSWVLGTKIVDDALWEDIINGTYNGYSMQIRTKVKAYDISYFSFPSLVGSTEVSQEHTHYYFLELDEKGRIIKGNTSVDDGHSHSISTNSITDTESDHSHRIVIHN